MHLRLEVLTVPSDVERAKASYVDQVGFGIEQDVRVDDEHRFVELVRRARARQGSEGGLHPTAWPRRTAPLAVAACGGQAGAVMSRWW